ncbi:MAG: hypothetical protein WC701_06670 [Kiritimatiellales bacterium]|jgi:hypothetical protein
MKKKTAAVLIAGWVAAWASGAEMPRMLLAAGNKVFVMESDKSVSWVFAGAGGVYDAWPMTNGNVLFSSKFAVLEVTPEKKTVWEYRVEPNAKLNELDSCQLLENGNILIMDSGHNRLIEVNRAKEILVEIPLPSKAESPHARYRIGRKTVRGTYLVGMLQDRVQEYAANGTLLREINLKTLGTQQGGFFVFDIVELKNGNLIISTGFDGRWLEVTPDNKIVWEVSKKTMPELNICFAGGAVRLPDGNTILCNGDWHVKKEANQAVQLLEVTPDYRIAWSVSHSDLEGRIAPVQEKENKLAQFQLTQVKVLP